MTTATEPSLKHRFENDLLPNTNWETVLNALGLDPKAKSDHFLITCPKCGKKEGAFYPNKAKSDPRFICSRREKCQYSDHILSYLNNGEFPRGDEWVKAVQKLASLTGLPFELSDRTLSKNCPKTSGKNVLKDYWKFLQSRLPGSPAEIYLTERGINPDACIFGYFPNRLDEALNWAKDKGYTEEELIDCGIVVEGEQGNFISMYGRLAGAFIDQKGEIHNLWGRDLTGRVERSKKYLNLKDTEVTHKKSPYGADCFRKGTVYWVEGYLDVAAAKECNITAVASGTSSIPQDMVASLHGVEAIVIALDKDGAGADGAFKFIEKNSNNRFKLYTINHHLMKGCKDIAELYQKHGRDAVEEVFRPDNLDSAFSFAATYILNKHRPTTGWSPVAKESALEEARAFDARVTAESKLPLLAEYFWKNGIQKELDLDPDAMDAMLDAMNNKKNKAQLEEKLVEYSAKAAEKARDGDFDAAAAISKDITELHRHSSGDAAEASIKFIKDFGEDWLNQEPPEKEMLLSYTNTNNNSQGFLPKGIVAMLAGAGGVGKSHLVTQLAIAVLTGLPLFDKYNSNEKGAVFLGMGENSIDDIRRILWKNSKTLNKEEKASMAKKLAVRSFHGQDASFLNENSQPSNFYYKLKRELINTAPEDGWSLLIFDPASRLMGIDAEKDNALATRFISLLEELTEDVPGNPTVLFVHHVSKAAINQAEQQNQSAARGASALTDGCRLQLNLFKNKDKENKYTLSVTKTNFTAVQEDLIMEKNKYGLLIISDDKKLPPKQHQYN